MGKKVFLFLSKSSCPPSSPSLTFTHSFIFHPSSKLKSKPFFCEKKKLRAQTDFVKFLNLGFQTFQFNLVVVKFFIYFLIPSLYMFFSLSFFNPMITLNQFPSTPSNDVDFRWIFITLAKVLLLRFPFHFHSFTSLRERNREIVLNMSWLSGWEQKKVVWKHEEKNKNKINFASSQNPPENDWNGMKWRRKKVKKWTKGMRLKVKLAFHKTTMRKKEM